MKHSLVIFLFPILCSCNPENDTRNKFSDAALVTIADLQDRRAGDSLVVFLNDAEGEYRRSAAIAFASLQDSTYVGRLQDLLESDADSMVRQAAAYAIGQTPGLRSELALARAASKEKVKIVLSEIIQAYGKVARSWKLNVTTRDTITSTALAWAYYRMAVRQLSDTSLNSKSAELLRSGNSNARFAAAHYFARGAKDFDYFEDVLINATLNENSPLIRMPAVLALGKIRSQSSLTTIIASASDADYRVRINALRSLQNFPFTQIKETLIKALNDSNSNVGIAASETIKGSVTGEHSNEFLSIARKIDNWRVQANLLEAALSVSGSKELVEEIIELYKKSTNVYQRAALLTALQPSLVSVGFLHEHLMKSSQPVIKSSAATAIVAMNHHKNFDRSLTSAFAKYYEEAVGDGDMAVIGIVCSALADSALNFRSVIKDFSFLRTARGKLSLPRDYESVVPLDMAINYFEGKSQISTLANDFNHPIQWNLVRMIHADQKAIIKTSKGNITIRLLVNEAPGSVANFVSLASNKYYDGRRVHRVAPNFVVQDGCPRGDGWGSEAYSIRSEFTPYRYVTGSIGMASAGKDTEGTQWFITHSPTPHLEGRYTLFAEVESGMDVVHRLEVGDTIIAVEIIGFNPV